MPNCVSNKGSLSRSLIVTAVTSCWTMAQNPDGAGTVAESMMAAPWVARTGTSIGILPSCHKDAHRGCASSAQPKMSEGKLQACFEAWSMSHQIHWKAVHNMLNLLKQIASAWQIQSSEGQAFLNIQRPEILPKGLASFSVCEGNHRAWKELRLVK